MNELTPKQRAFIAEYLIDINATQAAIRAGYSKRTAMVQASRLLKNVKVAAAVEQGRAERMERTEIDQDWVIRGLVENCNRAMEAVPVLDAKGEPTGQYTYNGAVANRALELVGRHLGMFIDRSEAHVTHHQGDPLDDATLEDLQLMLADLRTQKALLLEQEALVESTNVIEAEARAID